MARFFVVALLCLAIYGCGGSAEQIVTGKVTLNGQPLAGAEITLEGLKKSGDKTAPGSFSTATDDGGNFEIKKPKISPGKYKVSVAKYVDDKGKSVPPEEYGMLKRSGKLKNEVPAAYGENSTLMVEVKDSAKTDVGTLELKKP